MEGKKHRIIIVILMMLASVQALCNNYRTEIYRAYVSDKMDIWKDVIDRMNAISSKNDEFILELVNYQYGYIGYCIGFDKKSEARKYLDLAQQNVNILMKHNYRLSILNAYNAAFYGYRIGLNVLSAPVNGVKSIEYAKKAVDLDPGNWLGWVQYGNIQFYMPRSFGGSKQEGITYYYKAREILEKEKDRLREDWNYLSLLVVIGQSHTYLGEYVKAREVFENILRLEPGFTYVRDELYPQLLKKMKES
jgi:tetratricopeptide (TPR) repeat protein